MKNTFSQAIKVIILSAILSCFGTGCFTMWTHGLVGSEKVEIDNWSFNTTNSDTLEIKTKVNFTYYYLPFDFNLSVPCGHKTKEFIAHIPVRPEIVPAEKIHTGGPIFAFERGISTVLADSDERLCGIKILKSSETNRRFAIHSSGIAMYGKLCHEKLSGNNIFSNRPRFYNKKLCIEYHPDDSHYLLQPFIYSEENIGMALLLPLYEENGLLHCVMPYVDTRSFWNFWTGEHTINNAGMEFYRFTLTPLTICLDIVTGPVQLVWFYYAMRNFP